MAQTPGVHHSAVSKCTRLPRNNQRQFQHADKFLGGSGDEKPFNLGLASNYENTDTGERCYLIGVFDQQIATLVHECAHVCFYVCSDVGVTTRPEDANETYCYMLDRMVNHFLPFIQEKQDVSLE